ncbi:endonuclease MutS2, partial [Candidatus Bipolaricaulota bacterium]|nr:endonuclease MutS2 [Candidatus Bipolaricaulota bacterium]
KEDLPLLRRFAERLSEASELAKRITRTIDEAGEIRDDASPTLKQLMGKRRTLEERIEKKLHALIERNPELISEAVVTRRTGRLVIPIKSGATGAMEFVVHDRSATGQTLYAEPTSLVAENNAVVGIESEIRKERLHILRELTDAFKQAEPAFLRDRMILAHLDSLFARATYAAAHHCSFPHLSGVIVLRDARHPLLPEKRVVPISLSLGGHTRMTVITGPNTGGKTVTLKTIGLLTLMTQSVIPIPASPDSELAIAAKVRSDIGDEQSIEQNLSTFSSHMGNIVSILKEADADSLILLDELGAGTDPQEGAALGLAILEDLLSSEALVAASTHLTPLKYFAIRHPTVKTASVEFDVETLSPTFRVVEGIPGRSNAFVIARGLGLSAPLVKRARSFLSEGEINAEDIIEELQRERQTMINYRRKAQQELSEAKKLEESYQERLAAFESAKEEELSSRLKELEAFLRRG